MECRGNSLSKGVHHGFFVSTRSFGACRPFWVPFIKWSVSHSVGVHVVCSFQCRIRWDEVLCKVSFECCPCSKTCYWLSYDGFLLILGPISCWGSYLEVCKRG